MTPYYLPVPVVPALPSLPAPPSLPAKIAHFGHTGRDLVLVPHGKEERRSLRGQRIQKPLELVAPLMVQSSARVVQHQQGRT